MTKNAGKTWTNVTPKDMPDFGRVSIIDASAFDSATAYAAVKRPLLDDQAPYIFRTHDFGKTWTKIVNGIAADDYVHVGARRSEAQRLAVRGDAARHLHLVRRRRPLGVDVAQPADMPIADIEVEDHDIAIATHGRGFYVLDNIEPLRQYKPAMAAETDAVLFTPATAIRSGTPATMQYWLKHPAQQRAHRYPRREGPARAQPSPTLPTPVVVAAVAAAPDWRAPGGGGGRGAAARRRDVPRKTDRAELLHVGRPRTRQRGDVPGDDSLGRDDERPARARPAGTRCDSPRTENGARSRSSLKRNPLHEATDADLAAQTQLALQIRDKVSEANNAVIQIRDSRDRSAIVSRSRRTPSSRSAATS